MTIPFLDLFNKLRGRFTPKTTESVKPQAPRVVRPSGDRLSKTVVPRPTAPRVIGAEAPRAFAPAPRARELPPALAKALEPKLERAISLQLSEFLDQIPAEYVKPVEVIDANRPVSLKASEVEKGMPERKPSILLASLYQQVPGIFLKSVAASDPTRVLLPYEKVLEQFSNVQVRADQQHDDRVPQLETPILQATLEDTERFGTKMEPVVSSSAPNMPVKPPTAANFASAEPEAAVTEVVGSSKSDAPRPAIKLSPTETKPEKTPYPFQFKTTAPPPPLKIPFQFPPNGTGAPASERVPASSGPPVPPLSKSPPKLTPPEPAVEKTESTGKTPEKIAFQLEDKAPEAPQAQSATAKREEPVLKLAPAAASPEISTATLFTEEVEAGDKEPVGTVFEEAHSETSLEALEREYFQGSKGAPIEKAANDEGSMVELALKPIFENMPIFQRDGDAGAVSESARIKFALNLIQPQLATGRVLIAAKTFKRLLPPNYRSLFAIDPEETPVSLPLQEVLKNFPVELLKVREDQQRFLPEDDIVTPISEKAKEDAERFQAVEETAKTPGTAPEAAKTGTTGESAEKIDAKKIVSTACDLPGVAGCEVMFPDGLSLAGNLPSEMGADGLCAMAPTLLQRIETHMSDTKLGRLAAMTLHGETGAITLFASENIYLAALHKDAAALACETRAKLAELLEQLSHAFAKPEVPHVDH